MFKLYLYTIDVSFMRVYYWRDAWDVYFLFYKSKTEDLKYVILLNLA